MTNDKFEIGEKVIIRNSGYGCCDTVNIIKEITKGGNYKTNKGEIFNSDGKLRGGSGYHTIYLEKYTDEKFKEIRTKQLRRYLKLFDFEKLSFEKLNRIWEITKEE